MIVQVLVLLEAFAADVALERLLSLGRFLGERCELLG